MTTPWTPAEIATILWLDAADANTLTMDTGVSVWSDKSGNGNDYYQTSGANQPTVNAAGMNGLSTLSFDGTYDYLKCDTPINFINRFIFIVTKCSPTDGTYGVIYGHTTSNYQIRFDTNGTGFEIVGSPAVWGNTLDISGLTANTTMIVGIDGNSAGGRLLINGTERDAGSADVGPRAFNMLGTRAAIEDFFYGDIAEILIVDSAIADSDTIHRIEGYLAWKWGTQASLPSTHPYKYFAPALTVIPTGSVPWTPEFIKVSSWHDFSDASSLLLSGSNITAAANKANNGLMCLTPTEGNAPVISTDSLTGETCASFPDRNANLQDSTNYVSAVKHIFAVHKWADTTTAYLHMFGAVNDFHGSATFPYLFGALGDQNGYAGITRTNGSLSTVTGAGATRNASWNILEVAPKQDTGISGDGIVAPMFNGTGYQSGLGRSFTGYMGEILSFDYVLTVEQRFMVEGYLAHKWGLAFTLRDDHPYKSAPPMVVVSTTEWTPAEIATSLWLDAAEASTLPDTSNVSYWYDKSGNGRNVVQGTSANQPTRSNNEVVFDGTDDFFSLGDTLDMGTDELHGFVVARHDTLNGHMYGKSKQGLATGRYGLGTYGGNAIYSTLSINSIDDTGACNVAFSDTGKHIFSQTLLRNANLLYLDGALVANTIFATQATSYDTTYPLYIGAYGNADGTAPSLFMDGAICELILIKGTLSQANRQNIEGYLAHKWGLVSKLPSTHPYKVLSPRIQVESELWTPMDIKTVLWLDPADASTVTASPDSLVLADKSRVTRDAIQNSLAIQPVLSTMHGKNALSFNGSTNYMDIAKKPIGTCSVFHVQETTDTDYIMFGSLSGGYSLCAQAASTGDLSSNFGTPLYYINGKLSVSTTRPNIWKEMYAKRSIVSSVGCSFDAFSNFGLSKYTSGVFYYFGKLGDVIIVDGVVSTDVRQKIEGYLAWKWGTVSELPADHPYKYYPPIKVLTVDNLTRLLIQSDTTDGSTVVSDNSPYAMPMSVSGSLHHAALANSIGATKLVFGGDSAINLGSNLGAYPESVAFTLEFVFTPDASDLSGLHRIFDSTTSSNGGYSLYVNTNKIAFNCADNSGSWLGELLSSTAMVAGTSYHIAIERTANGVITIYQDGVAVASASRVANIYANKNVYIGAYAGTSQFIIGSLEEIRFVKGMSVYNGPFTPRTTLITSPTAPTVEATTITAKSVVFDIADKHTGGDAYMAVRCIEFFKDGALVPMLTDSFAAYATTSFSGYPASYAFLTTLPKTSIWADNSWVSANGYETNQRLIIVFNSPVEFDEIRINNGHNDGAYYQCGIKNTKITVSPDEITDTTYNAAISNDTELFNGIVRAHVALNVEDPIRVWSSIYGKSRVPTLNADHNTSAKATSSYGATTLPEYAVDPLANIMGSNSNTVWMSTNSVIQNKFNVDCTTEFVLKKLYIENYHDSGSDSTRGIKDVEVYGTNSATAFANTTFSDLTDLTYIGKIRVAQHVASNSADPQYFDIDNDQSFRYYVLRILSNHGDAGYAGIRHIEFKGIEYVSLTTIIGDSLVTLESVAMIAIASITSPGGPVTITGDSSVVLAAITMLGSGTITVPIDPGVDKTRIGTQYSGKSRLYLTVISGTGPSDWVVQLPAAPVLIAILGLDSDYYDASGAPKNITWATHVDNNLIRFGDKGATIYITAQDAASIVNIDKVIAN